MKTEPGQGNEQEKIIGWASIACLVLALASIVPLCIGFWMKAHYYGATCAVPFLATLVLAGAAIACGIYGRGEWGEAGKRMLIAGIVVAVAASYVVWIPLCWAVGHTEMVTGAVLCILAGGVMWALRKWELGITLLVLTIMMAVAVPSFVEALKKEAHWACPYKTTEIAESALRALVDKGETLRYDEQGRVPVYYEGYGNETIVMKVLCPEYNAPYKIDWSIADGATSVTVSCRWNPEHWCSCSLRLSGTNLTERIMARRHGSEMYEWAHSCFPVDQLCSNTFERARGW